MKRLDKKLLFFLLISLSLLIAFLTRFYKLPERTYFQLDEERDMHLVRRTIVYHDIPLIGSMVPGGFFLGPIYLWITTILSLPFNSNPFILPFLASLLGVISTWLIYVAGKMFFNSKETGIIACFLWASSFLISFFNQIWWPQVFTPIITLITYIALCKIKRGNQRAFIPLTLALIIGIGSDHAIASLIIATFTLLLIWKTPIKKIGLMLIAFLLAQTPLLIFDLKHNFQNTNNFLKLITSPLFSNSQHQIHPFSTLGQVAKIFLYTVSNTIFPFSYPDRAYIITWCKEYYQKYLYNTTPRVVIAISSFILVLGIAKLVFSSHKFNTARQILFIHTITSMLGIYIYQLMYPGYLHIWFFHVLFVAIIMYISVSLSVIYSKLPFLATSIIVLLVIFNTVKSLTTNHTHSLLNRQRAVNYAISTVGKTNNIDILSLGKCYAWSGYRYLYTQAGIIPAKTYLDERFGSWLFPQELNLKTTLNWQIVFVDHEDLPLPPESEKIYREATSKAISRARFGNVEVMIIPSNKNSQVF